jgi:predicted pyridoxine 5'-phosphate oxidase superfamily flavin-nucleotide-binding protein
LEIWRENIPFNNLLLSAAYTAHRRRSFFLPGIDDMMRINGIASVTTEPERFLDNGKSPRSVIVVETRQAYFHRSKALRRSDLWNPDKRLARGAFPSLGQIARDQFKLMVPAKRLDPVLARDAKKNLY